MRERIRCHDRDLEQQPDQRCPICGIVADELTEYRDLLCDRPPKEKAGGPHHKVAGQLSLNL
jgi:hypothetical protein